MYTNVYMKVGELTAEFLGFDATILEASLQEAQAIAQFAQQIKQDQNEVKSFCEKKREIQLLEEQVKAIILDKVQLEVESEKTLQIVRSL